MGETAATDRGLNERELALRLHALSRAEQKRLLARLPREERNILAGLLNELKSLGIPKGAVQALNAKLGPEAPQAQELTEADNEDPAQIRRVLAQEPAPVLDVVASVLDMDSDEDETGGPRVTDATRQALISIVRQRLTEERLADE